LLFRVRVELGVGCQSAVWGSRLGLGLLVGRDGDGGVELVRWSSGREGGDGWLTLVHQVGGRRLVGIISVFL
jgi:hypothetical protein